MQGLFECDSLWCCWTALMSHIGHGLWAVRYPVVAYLFLYMVGAVIFLATLKLRSVDGTLVVERNSWAYMLAHPMRYGGLRTDYRTNTSICRVYARLFNMLLFVWPVLLVYFALMLTLGNLGAFLLAGHVIWPTLREKGFLKMWGVFGQDEFVPLIMLPTAVLIIVKLIYSFWAVMHFFGQVGWWVLCLAPVLLVVGAVVYLSRKTYVEHDVPGTTVNAAKQYVEARKEKFCKMVKIK